MQAETDSRKREVVRRLMEKGVLISTDLLDTLEDEDTVNEMLSREDPGGGALLISKDTKDIEDTNINWMELDKTKALMEKSNNDKPYKSFINYIKEETSEAALEKPVGVDILFNYSEKPRKREVQHFVKFFNARYQQLERLLRQRQELQGLTSINKLLRKTDRETVSIIGLVDDKQTTKNNNVILTLEDPTGSIKVIVSNTKPDLFEEAKNIVPDEVLGVVGANANKVIFANSILFPDIPLTKELKKGPKEEYAVFLSDLHVGSDNFLEEEFTRFIQWINREVGSEAQKKVAAQVRWVFIVGDLVDGVGVYPGQEHELVIKDIKEQYRRCAELIDKIPKNIHVIVCPGNHDSIRIAEPQPPIYQDIAADLWGLDNVHILSNPATVNIGKTEGFPGFDVLLYHGYSFDYYIANVDEIRTKGGYDRADLVMSFLLRKRHLAPTHASTLYVPDSEKDSLVIETVPDFFITGHIHKASVSNYRGVTLVSGSCWQAKTAFQEKVGHHPEPARVPIVNLMTREVKMLKFGGDNS